MLAFTGHTTGHADLSIIPDHALGLPVLRALSLCTCCRHYPGAAAGRIPRSSHPAVSAFPGRGAGSACTSTFSRLAQRSLALQPDNSLISPKLTLSVGFSISITPHAATQARRFLAFIAVGLLSANNESHPMDHDSNSSGHTKGKDLTPTPGRRGRCESDCGAPKSE